MADDVKHMHKRLTEMRGKQGKWDKEEDAA